MATSKIAASKPPGVSYEQPQVGWHATIPTCRTYPEVVSLQRFAVRLNHNVVGTLAFVQKVFMVRVCSDGEAGQQQCKLL